MKAKKRPLAGIVKSRSGHYTVWMAHTFRTFDKLSKHGAQRVLAAVKEALAAPTTEARDRMLDQIYY